MARSRIVEHWLVEVGRHDRDRGPKQCCQRARHDAGAGRCFQHGLGTRDGHTLRKIGRKKLPLYRIVVADKESPRDGRFIEILGTYDPKQEGAKKVVIDVEKAKSWLGKGATPTDTVEALLKSAGVIAAAPKA